MIERINKMANEAMYDEDKFLSGNVKCNDSSELEDPNKIADGLFRFFDTVPIKYWEGDKLCGRMRFGGLQYPGDFYRRNGHYNCAKYWYECCHLAPNPLFYWGWTHIVLDYDFVLKNGLVGYINLIDEQKEKTALHEAMKKSLYGASRLFERYAKACTDKKLSEIAAKVPMKPAESFYEAVQSVWSMFQLCPDSLGRIDQYLYPFYKKDIASGEITKDDVIELLEELFVKVYETQKDNLELPISGHNHLVVGGYLEDGTDGFNELSKIILHCIAELPTFRPQASFRYTKFTTPETMKYVTELNAKCQWIVFVNDEPRIPGMVKIGIDYKDAVNYTVVGCNEWCLPSGARIDLAHINLLHSLERLLYDDEKIEKADSFDKLFDLYKDHLEKDMTDICDEYTNYAKAISKDINVITSALNKSCIESGRSITDRGSKYYGLTMSFNSISNIVDSLSVIKQFVYEEKKYSISELINMLKNNYEGFEEERRYILKKGRFFGNDIDFADDIAKEIVDAIYDIRDRIKNDYINVLAVGSFVGATHPNIIFGKLTKATPDGRRNGDAFTMGITQSEGKDVNGLTALLKSISKLDYTKFCGCIVSNIKMDKTMADTDEKIEKLSQMYYAFLKMGGMQLQINYLSQEELLEAQKNPENYQNLVVRVTGYSGYFTRFTTDLQNDIIRRTIKEV